MTSWRTRRILDLLSQNKIESEKEDFEPVERKDYEETVVNNLNCTMQAKDVEIQENMPPAPNIICDKQILVPHCLLTTGKTTVSLVPDYDSEGTLSENEITNANDCNIEPGVLAPKNYIKRSSSSSSSSSTSSSSSSTSSSSSSSSSSEPSNQKNGLQPEGRTQSPSNSPTCSVPERRIRQRKNKESVANYNISPIYTDQSDIDLSDDDPTIDFDKLLDKPSRRRNLLFDQPTPYSSDSDCSTEQNDRRGRKRSRNVNKWQQNTSKRMRNKVSERMVYTVQSKMNEGFMMEDLRGRHNNHKKLNPQLIQDIKTHIDMIPKIESHYVRASTSKQYIGGDKTIKDLYNDFVTQQTETNRERGNYMAYYKIFTKEFNLGFFQTKKDQCDLCVSYNNSNTIEKQLLEVKYLKHLEEKTLSRSEKEADRQNITKDSKVVIYDLEAVLQCPRGDTSAFYYKSKLNSYNLTLTELEKREKKAYDNVHCYFWTEVDAKRGANEIGSCVWEYLKTVCAEDASLKQIIFYSDNCCGQNKNKYITTLYLYAVNYLNISSITHKFLIRGHTQNEADSVHSLIEREVKKNLRSGPIYSPDQYVALIKNAKKSKPAINVHELTFESFVNLKALQEEWGYNFTIDKEGNSVNWNDIKVLKMIKSEPLSFYYKTSYSDTIFKEVDVRNKRKKMLPISDISLTNAYNERQQLSDNKKRDLKELITKKLIPSFYTNFYNSII
ncbi:hypothetical protein evm_011184 [Chilo suppressalis]|nr:hypothetical protein evm_011184 [Chilo suppressalis]